MLRFIVLGEIPGTDLVITFYWVLILAISLFICFELYTLLRKLKLSTKAVFIFSIFSQRQAK